MNVAFNKMIKKKIISFPSSWFRHELFRYHVTLSVLPTSFQTFEAQAYVGRIRKTHQEKAIAGELLGK